MKVEPLNLQEFRDKIFEYEGASEWNYKGSVPSVIDFYADWCGPCKMVAPVLEELAIEFDGQVNFYKVDTEKEQELSAMFGIQSIPTFLFIPVDSEPMMQPGALPKHVFKEVISKHLLKQEDSAGS